MTELERWANDSAAQPLQSAPLGFFEEKRYQRSLTRIDHQADLQLRAIELEADIGQAKVQAVANVGNAALTAQTMVSARAKLLVESEPSAVHGVSHISQKVTLALGAVLDNTLREVTR